MKRLDKREDSGEDKKILKRASIAVFITVLVLFALVIGATYAVEYFFGKTAGTIALVILAGIIAISLYRKEIASFFRRR